MQELWGADGEAGCTGLRCGTHPAPWAGVLMGHRGTFGGERQLHCLCMGHWQPKEKAAARQAARCLQVP